MRFAAAPRRQSVCAVAIDLRPAIFFDSPRRCSEVMGFLNISGARRHSSLTNSGQSLPGSTPTAENSLPRNRRLVLLRDTIHLMLLACALLAGAVQAASLRISCSGVGQEAQFCKGAAMDRAAKTGNQVRRLCDAAGAPRLDDGGIDAAGAGAGRRLAAETHDLVRSNAHGSESHPLMMKHANGKSKARASHPALARRLLIGSLRSTIGSRPERVVSR